MKLKADWLKALLIIPAGTIINLAYLINKTERGNAGVKCESTTTENRIFNEIFVTIWGKRK
jgi:hypothetical protein